MSITIKNIPLSFFQFTDDPCENPLPVQSESDLKFQVMFGADDIAEGDNLLAGDIDLFVVTSGAVIESDSDINTFKVGSGVAVPANIMWRIDETTVGAYWNALFNDFAAIGLDTCFKFAVRVTVGASKYYWASNCFIRVNDNYTSTIEYSCAENSFGFNYCDRFIPNKVRLPFFLSRAQYKTDRSVYFKSDGSARVTKSITRKEMDGMTDHLTDDLHQKLSIALEHSTVYIESSQYSGQVAKSEDYDIAWTDINDYLQAPAKFKVNVTPYDATLNNCADCQAYEEPTCSSAIQFTQSGITGDDLYAQWEVVNGTPVKFKVSVNDGTAIEQTELLYSLNDQLPGSYTIKVIPVCLAGTTEIEGTEISVTLTIPDPEEVCVAVSHTDFGTLSNAHIDDYYSAIIALTGTMPFTLISATKPAWLNATISGSSLILSGTPYAGSEGNGIALSFSISNCESDTHTINTTINVIGNTSQPLAGIRIWNYEEAEICARPYLTVYLEAGTYSFALGVTVYSDPALVGYYADKYLIDQDGTLWRTNIFGMIYALVQTNYC